MWSCPVLRTEHFDIRPGLDRVEIMVDREGLETLRMIVSLFEHELCETKEDDPK